MDLTEALLLKKAVAEMKEERDEARRVARLFRAAFLGKPYREKVQVFAHYDWLKEKDLEAG